jgi:hypothetical protein
LGTPNLVTGINNPVINDKDFITKVYPTISQSTVQYLVGNKPDVKKISVQYSICRARNFTGWKLAIKVEVLNIRGLQKAPTY